MNDSLRQSEFFSLVKTVFSPGENDKRMAILIDLPDAQVPDNPEWKARRSLAEEWFSFLKKDGKQIGLSESFLIVYPNVHSNNGDLPRTCFSVEKLPQNVVVDKLPVIGQEMLFEELLSSVQLVMAPTEFSATAPLKVLAKKYGFRAATLPGFSAAMIPALRLDWTEIHSRILKVKTELDHSMGARLELLLDRNEKYECYFDLRGKSAHASGGLIRESGTAGNLPSGECYIVPVEGEESKTSGILPVQYGDEIVKYQIEKNQAVNILSVGAMSDREKALLNEEPAYGNIAELGFGILRPFGIKPIGQVLLDEKLGFHVAFGRSDHFGGRVGPRQFKKKENVIHIDRIYIPETQPRLWVKSLILEQEGGTEKVLIANNEYAIF